MASRFSRPAPPLAIALAGLLASGCTGTPESAEGPVGIDTVPPSALEPSEESAVEVENVHIEGMPERMLVRRFASPIDFPLGFYTRVPADMVEEFVSSGEGDVVRFEAAFGGVLRRDAFLAYHVIPEGTVAADAREMVAGVAREAGATRRSGEGPHRWATDQYTLTGEYAGFLALGQHRDVWFYFLASYPPEYGDGMGPRIDLILRNWIWADDGTRLVPE
jgi:hypothetical protein